jgi:hypothetical protein
MREKKRNLQYSQGFRFDLIQMIACSKKDLNYDQKFSNFPNMGN